MRIKILFLAVAIALSLFSAEKAQISFKEKKHNFGKIRNMEKDSVIFHFENTGDIPLVINKVTTTCGCTVSDWTKQPVEKGEKGYVKAIYDPKGQNGKFLKSIYVKSNAENDVVILKIEGEVINRLKKEGGAE